MQHIGFGKRLIYRAESIAWKNGYRKIAIISAVGTRDYYRKMGYHLENTYMVKTLTRDLEQNNLVYYYLLSTIIAIIAIYTIIWK